MLIYKIIAEIYEALTTGQDLFQALSMGLLLELFGNYFFVSLVKLWNICRIGKSSFGVSQRQLDHKGSYLKQGLIPWWSILGWWYWDTLVSRQAHRGEHVCVLRQASPIKQLEGIGFLINMSLWEPWLTVVSFLEIVFRIFKDNLNCICVPGDGITQNTRTFAWKSMHL